VIEIEKKYRLTPSARDEMRGALGEIGAEHVGEEFEENIIFTSEALAEWNAILRIRRTSSRTILTFKRRLPDSAAGAKHQVEHETDVADADELLEIVRELGLRPTVVYEKLRGVWRYKGAEIAIDELPFGLFMEIEGTITAIREAELMLDADKLDVEPATYPTLTARLGIRDGDAVVARFPRDSRS
jgi:adenylate cyclase class 2